VLSFSLLSKRSSSLPSHLALDPSALLAPSGKILFAPRSAFLFFFSPPFFPSGCNLKKHLLDYLSTPPFPPPSPSLPSLFGFFVIRGRGRSQFANNSCVLRALLALRELSCLFTSAESLAFQSHPLFSAAKKVGKEKRKDLDKGRRKKQGNIILPRSPSSFW
jgi:hypothetical protein